MGTPRKELPEMIRLGLYGPDYRIAESARYADIHPQMLSRWFNGAIPTQPDKRRKGRVSYMQTLEAAFVGTFRSLGAPMPSIRKMRNALAEAFCADFPFGFVDVKTNGPDVVRGLCGKESALSRLVVPAPSGGWAWHPLVAERVAQCDYDNDYGVALRWFFRGRNVPLLIDRRFSFGAPIVPSGIATWALAGRFRAGERRESILSDFPYVTPEALEAALEFEGLLQAAA